MWFAIPLGVLVTAVNGGNVGLGVSAALFMYLGSFA